MPKLSKPYIGGEIVKMLNSLIGGVDQMRNLAATSRPD